MARAAAQLTTVSAIGRVLVPALATITLLAGCGDDDGPTQEEFVAEAGSICERNKARADRVAQREFETFGKGAPSPSESQQFLAAVLPIIRSAADV